jgi:UDP-N-acetyl-D-mannosaminuronate dehydrogenase
MRLKVKNKISLIGMGCIGLGNALMLAKKKAVSIVAIDLKKIEDFKMLTKTSDLIARNKLDDQIQPFSYKVFSRDIFSTD